MQASRTPHAELFKVLLENNRNEVVHAEIVSIGSVRQTLVIYPAARQETMASMPTVPGPAPNFTSE